MLTYLPDSEWFHRGQEEEEEEDEVNGREGMQIWVAVPSTGADTENKKNPPKPFKEKIAKDATGQQGDGGGETPADGRCSRCSRCDSNEAVDSVN